MRHIVLAAAASVVVLLCPPGAQAQGSMPAGSSADLGHLSQREDVPHRAAEASNRGIRELKKARDAREPADKSKHYAAAQAHFKKSLALEQNFDALLGLGQADLALEDHQGAATACLQALGLKPRSEEAKACADQAAAALSPAAPAATAPPPGPGSPTDPA